MKAGDEWGERDGMMGGWGGGGERRRDGQLETVLKQV